MSELGTPVKSTLLYEREQDGLHVRAIQHVYQMPVEGKEGETHEQKQYEVVGTLNGQQIHQEAVSGYRQTVFAGRTTFKTLYNEHVRPSMEAAAKEAAEQKASEKEARRIARAEERARKLAEKEAKLAAAKEAREAAKAEKEAAAQKQEAVDEAVDVADQANL